MLKINILIHREGTCIPKNIHPRIVRSRKLDRIKLSNALKAVPVTGVKLDSLDGSKRKTTTLLISTPCLMK